MKKSGLAGCLALMLLGVIIIPAFVGYYLDKQNEKFGKKIDKKVIHLKMAENITKSDTLIGVIKGDYLELTAK